MAEVTVDRSEYKLSDKDDTPQIGPVQDAIAAPTVAGETYDQAQVASIVTAVNEIRDVLLVHGLVKAE
jgi:hypothetical protein